MREEKEGKRKQEERKRCKKGNERGRKRVGSIGSRKEEGGLIMEVERGKGGWTGFKKERGRERMKVANSNLVIENYI